MIAAGAPVAQLGPLADAPGGAGAVSPPMTYQRTNHWSRTAMAIEVRIPTILRTYTGGQKSVEGSGAPSTSCSPTWTAVTTGCASGWSMTPGCAGSSTCT